LGIGYWENTTGVIARAKPVAIYDFLAIAFVFLSQDVFGLINSLFPLVRLPGRSRLHAGKISPASRSEKWGSKNPVHGLLLLEGWEVVWWVDVMM